MSGDLQTILDTLEIQRIKATYCVAADAVVTEPDKSAETLRGLFTPDVKGNYGYIICEGREYLLSYLVDAICQNNEWMVHGLQTPLIEVKGDRATGQWVIMVHIKQKHLPGKEVMIGRYVDEFVRTPDGWKIASIIFDEQGIYPQIDVTSPINPDPIILGPNAPQTAAQPA